MAEPRAVKPEEFQEMLDLVKLVFNSDLGQHVPLLYKHNALENLRVLERDGRLVTHIGASVKNVSILGCSTRIGTIGSVCTHPDYRRQGLATLVLEDVMKHLREDGATIMSVSGGRGLYLRQGCRSVGAHLNFRIDSATVAQLPDVQPVELVPYEPHHLRQVATLYEGESIRFWRSLDDFQSLFSIRQVLTIQRAGTIVAYIIPSIRKQRDGDGMQCRLAEFAGSRAAIVSAMRLLFRAHALAELTLGTSPYDIEMVSLLQAAGLEGQVSTVGNTTLIIDLPLLLEHFRPHIAQHVPLELLAQLKVESKAGNHTFRLGDECFSIADEDVLVQMVFGMPDRAEEKIMPTEGTLASVLRESFPLPLVSPGINNV